MRDSLCQHQRSQEIRRFDDLKAIVALLGLTLFATAAFAPPLAAAVIEVDGLTSAASLDGWCSLREAIHAANNNAPSGDCPAGDGPDTIVLKGSVILDLVDSFETGTPQIVSKIKLRGDDFEIERSGAPGTPEFRLFSVEPSGRLIIQDATLGNGGGATFDRNGGAIYNEGFVRLESCRLIGNSVHDRHGAGGAVFSAALSVLEAEGSTFSGNQAGYGGGITNYGAATIARSTFSGNHAAVLGGALDNLQTMTVHASTLEGNTASSGAGIYNYDSQASLSVTTSTISGNVASTLGGGLYADDGGSVVLNGSTIVGNSAPVSPPAGGGVFSFSNSLLFHDTLIANNTGDNCAGPGANTFAGDNRADDTSCGIAYTDPAMLKVDPALADNGGPTATHALLVGSDAIDAAGDCGRPTDQRGALRDSSCDVGAYEHGADDQYETSGPGGDDDTCDGHTICLGRAERHLHTADFSDWVWFQALEGATYEIETSNLIGGSDTVLELWNGCTPPMLAADDDGAGGLASRIVYTADTNDEQAGLSVLIRDFHGQGVNRGYDVTVTCTADCGPCPLVGGNDFVLREERVVTHLDVEACGTITASDMVVEPFASAVLAAGASVRLQGAFTVHEAAELAVEIDPDLQ